MRICKGKQKTTNNGIQHKHEYNRAQWNLEGMQKLNVRNGEMLAGGKKNNKPWKEKYISIFAFYFCFDVDFWLRISTLDSHFWSLLCFCYCYSCYDQWSSTIPATNVGFDLCLWMCLFFPFVSFSFSTPFASGHFFLDHFMLFIREITVHTWPVVMRINVITQNFPNVYDANQQLIRIFYHFIMDANMFSVCFNPKIDNLYHDSGQKI